MIELRDIIKSYFLAAAQVDVLKGVNLKIEEGEMIAIMGPSGAGKSTLMNIIGLLDRPTSGYYFLRGKAIRTYAPDELAQLRNRSIGFVFQSFFLLSRLTALQNVALPLMYRGIHAAERKRLAQEALDKVKVGHLAMNKPNELSGGQQQRVAIARAFVGKPDILLADEPTGALDSKTGREVMDLLRTLNKEENATIIVITHDLDVGKQCQRIIRIRDGKIVS